MNPAPAVTSPTHVAGVPHILNYYHPVHRGLYDAQTKLSVAKHSLRVLEAQASSLATVSTGPENNKNVSAARLSLKRNRAGNEDGIVEALNSSSAASSSAPRRPLRVHSIVDLTKCETGPVTETTVRYLIESTAAEVSHIALLS